MVKRAMLCPTELKKHYWGITGYKHAAPLGLSRRRECLHSEQAQAHRVKRP